MIDWIILADCFFFFFLLLVSIKISWNELIFVSANKVCYKSSNEYKKKINLQVRTLLRSENVSSANKRQTKAPCGVTQTLVFLTFLRAPRQRWAWRALVTATNSNVRVSSLDEVQHQRSLGVVRAHTKATPTKPRLGLDVMYQKLLPTWTFSAKLHYRARFIGAHHT